MSLKNSIFLNILSFLGYLNIIFCFYAFFLQIIISNHIPKGSLLSLYDVSDVLQIFLYISYFMIVASICEYIIRKKLNKANNKYAEEKVLKKIFSFLHSILFWEGIIIESLFIIFFTALNILI